MSTQSPHPAPWHISVITLMPEMYPGPLGCSLIGDALARGVWDLSLVNLRDFGIGPHQKVDDSPAGGGAGMVLKPEVVDAAIIKAKAANPAAQLIHFSPRGEVMTQALFRELIATQLILLCGRYEAIDERVLEKHQPREVSLGDFVLTGGDIPAMALIDGCVRLLPSVVGKEASLGEESFGNGAYANLLEYPHYTKPAEWEGRITPEVLLSGHHKNIDAWRLEQAKAITKARRPDLGE
jgi:tRNA (guanine37-N1)-methyltransferase